MMLTLEASIDNLDLEFRPIDFMRELFMSTPNLAKDFGDSRRSAITAPKHAQAHHARSTSYTVSAYTQRAYAGGGESSFHEHVCKASLFNEVFEMFYLDVHHMLYIFLNLKQSHSK